MRVEVIHTMSPDVGGGGQGSLGGKYYIFVRKVNFGFLSFYTKIMALK